VAGVPDIAVVGEAGDGQQAIEEARRCDPQVVLMDLRLPQLDELGANNRVEAALHALRAGLVPLETH